MRHILSAFAAMVLLGAALFAADSEKPASPFAQWKNGPPSSPDYFPIAVWLQDPRNAKRYKDAGINLYVALWDGPNEDQLKALTAAGMPVLCNQNALGLKHKDDPIIVGWMHGDEPDNAQSLPGGKGYGPPILPQKIVDDYKRVKEADPTRPVMLNLGQGVAFDDYIGRGVRCGKLEDYPEYMKGGDIVSFDIYPKTHEDKAVAGNLWFVPQGVSRLCKWGNNEKLVWNCIECTHVGNANKLPTPHDVRAEVWMALIHGSRGIIYFSHEFQPKFIEAGMFAHPELLKEITAINAQIKELAPVLNSATVKDGASVTSSATDVPIDTLVKHNGGATYLFASAMRNGETKGTFTLAGAKGAAKVEVLGEKKSLDAKDGVFADTFNGYDIHIYKIEDVK